MGTVIKRRTRDECRERAAPRSRRSGQPAIRGLVIACIDEGPGGKAAARIAASLARRLDSRLMLATVAQAQPHTPPGDDVTSGLVRRSRELLAGVARELDEPAEIRIAFGEPAERLIALAQREAAELIVVAAPDHSRATTLLGSVHIALAGAGPCPVVVVPPNVERMPTGGPIVCGVDGAEPSRIAAHFAADLAGRLDARLKLVQATGALSATAPGVRGGYGAARRPAERRGGENGARRGGRTARREARLPARRAGPAR